MLDIRITSAIAVTDGSRRNSSGFDVFMSVSKSGYGMIVDVRERTRFGDSLLGNCLTVN